MRARCCCALALAAVSLLGLSATSRAANMTWHGGPVLRAHNVYTIYWAPPGFSFDPGYREAIDGYFSNVSTALANGAIDNVYAVANQYCGASSLTGTSCDFGGPRPAFGGRADAADTYPAPADACLVAAHPHPVCLTVPQLTAEIQTVMAAKGWDPGLATGIFLLTPHNVDICEPDGCSYDSGGTSDFCAFHSVFTRADGAQVIWAIDPYLSDNPGCSVLQHPNGNTADVTLNTVSHEHIEMITDPITRDDTHPDGSGWFEDAAISGGEIADKCPDYGTSLGTTATGEYNQVINGSKYYLQQEWSNANGGCVLTGAPPPTAPPVTPPPAAPPAPAPPPPPVAPPSNHFAIKGVSKDSRGTLTLEVDTAGGGSVTADATTTVRGAFAAVTAKRRHRRIVSYGSAADKPSGPGTVTLVISPSRIARRQLRRGRKLKVSIAVTFTPPGGQPKAAAFAVRVKGRRRRR